ncbi:dehydrogenase/reductase SDR family member 4 [Amia ocellicauda]|uniref:dehydrogenase/reductase SDR family member 4 n=1 Tax=Amia ocellicauda TaxID=2972642 RepID=UPI00346419C5
MFLRSAGLTGRRLLSNQTQARRMMSQGSLSGKVAIVTASTDGIGLAAARSLAQRGASVMVSSRKEENVERAVKQLRSENLSVSGTVCNVGDAEHRDCLVTATVQQFGGVDILVSNAAVNPFFGHMLDCGEDAWDKIMDINVKTAFFLTKLVVPHMEKRGGGSIVFIASIAGYQPFTGLGPYSVSKTALLGLTKALTPELSPYNIRVNCVAPGLIKTRFSSAIWKNEDVAEEFLKQQSIKRLGVPEDVGGVVAFLCSSDAAFITGETIPVAGGMNCRL